ncbi:MAG: hypothetical protein OQK55_02270 [Thermoanaerobaculales bacterium]|nr:hypothetical protein [Thermoanaerobaculales bacterium]
MKKPVILLAVGVLVFFVCLTADAFGIGEGTGIGWKQITGVVIGLIIAAVGAIQMLKKT